MVISWVVIRNIGIYNLKVKFSIGFTKEITML